LVEEADGYRAPVEWDEAVETKNNEAVEAMANVHRVIADLEDYAVRGKIYHQFRYLLAMAIAGGSIGRNAIMRLTGISLRKAVEGVNRRKYDSQDCFTFNKVLIIMPFKIQDTKPRSYHPDKLALR
jgi:hypothetical protein